MKCALVVFSTAVFGFVATTAGAQTMSELQARLISTLERLDRVQLHLAALDGAVQDQSVATPAQFGAIRIQRVGDDFSRATAPLSDAWVENVDRSPLQPAPNPVQFNNLAPRTYKVSISNVPLRAVKAATCTYTIAVPAVDRCGVRKDSFSVDGIVCKERKCTKEVPVTAGMVTKIVFKYEKTSVAEQKYNFVIFLTDDQRADTLSVMPKVKEHLIDQGVNFTNAFVTTPLCCPNRASLLSGGFYAKNTGVLNNTFPNGGFAKFYDADTLVTNLKNNGYKTGLVGKYLNGYKGKDGYVPPGWDYFVANVTDGEPDWNSFDYLESINGSAGIIKHTTQYRTYFQRDRALEFLDSLGADQPFLLYVTPNAPHGPATSAPEDANLFEGPVTHGRAYMEDDVSDKPKFIQDEKAQYAERRDKAEEFYKRQFQSLQAVDRAVDAVVQKLKDRGLFDTTVFIFASDNGFMWGEHNLYGKGIAYEEAVRVPFVVRIPGVEARTDQSIVSPNLDIGPTIYELAGIIKRTDGASLLTLLNSPATPWRKELYLEGYGYNLPSDRKWAAVRTKKWKYVEYASGERELYNLVDDPEEMQSVHDSSDAKTTMDELAAKVRRQRGTLIISGNPPNAVVGKRFVYRPKAWGSGRAYAWSITDGALPEGLTLDPASGIISGKPTQVGIYKFTLMLRDSVIAQQTRRNREYSTGLKINVGTVGAPPLKVSTLAGGLTSVDAQACAIEGWAIDVRRQRQTMNYEIYSDGGRGVGTLAQSGAANAPTPDIESDPDYVGNHGFRFNLPDTFRDGARRMLYLYTVNPNTSESALFEDSPRAIICSPASQ